MYSSNDSHYNIVRARDARNVGKHESTIGGNFAYASVVKTKLEASRPASW